MSKENKKTEENISNDKIFFVRLIFVFRFIAFHFFIIPVGYV